MVSTVPKPKPDCFFFCFLFLTRIINGWCVYISFFASYRLLPRYQLVDQASLHGTQELVAGQSSVEIYESSEEQEWIDISSQVNSGFMTAWTAKEGWFICFFCGYCIVYGVWTFSVGGWISWIRLENRANDECERLVGSDISIIGFLVIMYDMLRFIIRDVANKGV